MLGEAVSSALAQTVADVEVLVVRNARGVDLSELPGDHRIRVLDQPRPGRPWAANLGASEARGDWLAMLDDDDIWEPTKLESQLEALSGWDGAPASITQFRLIDAEGNAIGKGWGAPTTYRDLLAGRVSFLFSSLLVARELWAGLGGLDSRATYSDDLALMLSIHAIGPAVFVDQPLVRYRRHATTMSSRQALQLAAWQGPVLGAERRFALQRGDWGAWAMSFRGSAVSRRWTTSEAFAEADRSFRQGAYRQAAALAWRGFRASPPDALRLLFERLAGRV